MANSVSRRSLIGSEATVQIPSATSSQQISGKNSVSVNKIAMKMFPKNLPFGVNFKHTQRKWFDRVGLG